MTSPDGDRAQALSARLPADYRAAFQAVPRAAFVPDRIWVKEAGDDSTDLPLDRATELERWLAAVYSDRALVTQFDDGTTAWPNIGHRPTSSASMPSVVAGMVRAVDARPGHNVLEIGTGTGWNAAILAKIVGSSGQVTTAEIDPGIAEAARKHLDDAGFAHVETRTADATTDLEDGSRYDRIIVTASVAMGRLPYSWVEQLRPGGVLVAPMRADLASGPLVRFVVGDDGTARGHAVPWLQVGFMELRSQRVAGLSMSGLRWDDEAADRTHTTLAPWIPLLTDDHRWAIAVALPSCRYDVWDRSAERPHGVAWLRDSLSDSWASVVPDGAGRYLVRQSGPRRLWDEAEAAYGWWQQCGSPPLSAWTWTITADSQSVVLGS